MWLLLHAVLLFASSTLSKGEIFDVTTIYDLSEAPKTFKNATGHVHVRTNALGLKLNSKNQELTRNDGIQQLNLTCDVPDCTWKFDSKWNFKSGVLKDVELKKAYALNSDVIWIDVVTLKYYSNDGYIYIHFTNGKSTDENSIIVSVSSTKLNIHSGCRRNTYGGYYYPEVMAVTDENGSDYRFHCSNNIYQNSRQNDAIGFKYLSSTGTVQFYKQFVYLTEIKRQYNSYIGDDGLVFKVYSQYRSNRIEPKFVLPLNFATVNNAEITSPLLMLEHIDQLCLALVVNSSRITEPESSHVLNLMAEDLLHVQHHILTVKNVETGLNTIRYCFNIENIPRPFKLILRSLKDITIIRISPYNPKGEEVWFLEPNVPSYNALTHSMLALTIPQPDTLLTGFRTEERTSIVSNNTCENGGVMTVEGCACRPGFSGMECQTGCGANGFGSDCGGMCSSLSKKCRNLLMCNSFTGCHCAPGFKGRRCENNCETGSYGNGCEQTCGHCLSKQTCDIYTGECQSCEPGYVPPYCKKVYVYYADNPAISSTDYGTIVVQFKPWDVQGVGTPELYQIQYREEAAQDWNIFCNKNIQGRENNSNGQTFIEEKLEGLKSGHLYQVRILLMDANFNKYDGNLVKAAEIITKCYVPNIYDYKMKTEKDATSVLVSWSYTNDTEYWCPVEHYEVYWESDWQSEKSNTNDEYFTLNDLLPNTTHKFKVRAKTTLGYAPFSEVIVSTEYEGSAQVRELQVITRDSTSAKIFWKPPRGEDRSLLYKITYKCIQQPACSPGCVNATEGDLTQKETNIVLSPLLPFAQYEVTVTPEDGPQTSIYVGTKKIVPYEVPKPSAQSSLKTNTSLTFFWDPVPVCSSFLLGYNYEFYKDMEKTKVLASGFTEGTNITFNNLTASTKYLVRVFVVTIAGWNPDAFLEMTAFTSATVPDAVRDLTVYKRGRNMLGLRWAAPLASYGVLKSFTVSYSMGTEESTQTVDLKPCVPWPQLYCHTINDLRANRKYNISVSVRNSEVNEDGEKTSITAVTKESSPMAPEKLRLTNSTSSTLSVEWCYPNISNGIIRSFLISVEETEQFKQDDCCQIFPLVEIPVQEEQLIYKSEVSGLHPASTYFVSVSAKTVGLGPSQSLVVYTKPPNLQFSILPQIESYSDAVWLPQESSNQLSNQSDIYLSLIKAHFLLVVHQTESAASNDSGVFNPKLDMLLHSLIVNPFFFYQEYNQDNLEVTLTTTSDVTSEWGACPSPSQLELKDVQLVAVQVSEYSNEFNVDLRYLSQTVTFDI